MLTYVFMMLPRIFRKNPKAYLVIGKAMMILVYSSAIHAADIGFLVLNSKAPERNQPIAFSHQLHVSQNGIACQYCHLYARRSYASGVPPVSTCVGCHGTKEMKLVHPAWKHQWRCLLVHAHCSRKSNSN